MAFEVREFEFEAGEEELVWKFKLGNINSSQLDFYSLDLSSRSLLHLAQDFNTQVEQCLEKKYKKADDKDRIIRKLTEKMIKNLAINIASFALDVSLRLCRSRRARRRCCPISGRSSCRRACVSA
jgi:hypothetical protein